LISASVGFPISVWNIILTSGKFTKEKKSRPDVWFVWIFSGSFWAIAVLYSPYIYNFSYFLKSAVTFYANHKPIYKTVSSHQATGMVIIFQLMVTATRIISDYISSRIHKRAEKKANNASMSSISLAPEDLIDKEGNT
jgi:hypothetical protein